MKRVLSILAALIVFAAGVTADMTPQEKYIAKYAPTAVQEMYRSGVPASITLAQGMLESRYGLSELASKGNNHFGIKCHDWKGRSMKVDDDRKGECFRVYGNAAESYADHSDFLRYRTRYRSLFELETTDYKGWAYGLSKAGYATDPQYAPKLIRIIEEYNLTRFDVSDGAADASVVVQEEQRTSKADKHSKEEVKKETRTKKEIKAEKKRAREEKRALKQARRRHIPVPPSELEQPQVVERTPSDEQFHFPLSRKVYRQNGVPFIYSMEGETYAGIAENNDMFEDELLRYNDLKSAEPLAPGTVVYLKSKKSRAAKGLDKHIVDHDGESLRDICQHYAVKMKSVAKLNGFSTGHALKEGDTIILR